MYPDVIVEPHGDDEWIAMGREAAVAGETLILDIIVARAGVSCATGFRCG